MKKIILFFIIISNSIFSQDYIEGSFSPTPGKYIVSAWVKEIHTQQKTTYTSSINININNDVNSTTYLFYPTGQTIEGWQRIIGIIEILEIIVPTTNSSLFDESGTTTLPNIEIQLMCNNNSNNECYFDDIRFYPYNGNMKSFVYDEETQRLMAELDENNYATFYEYDLEGGLVRVKKETERGVYTIQETRSNNPKKNE